MKNCDSVLLTSDSTYLETLCRFFEWMNRYALAKESINEIPDPDDTIVLVTCEDMMQESYKELPQTLKEVLLKYCKGNEFFIKNEDAMDFLLKIGETEQEDTPSGVRQNQTFTEI